MMAVSGRSAWSTRAAALLVSAAIALFAIVLVRTAWVSDDAYITFRVVDNLIAGHGPRWNAVERVQAYTHPLWMLLVAAATAVARQPYYASLALSFVCTLAALTIYARRVAASAPLAAVGLTAFLFSQAFVDFSTSGLENPLTHLLIVLFLARYFRTSRTVHDVGVLSALAALVMLTRLDAGLIVLPALLHAVWAAPLRHNRRALMMAVLAGMLPLIAWEVFSLVYYGFPFPNTAYAKLKTGIPAADLARQGIVYLQDSLERDPITLTMTTVALVMSLIIARAQAWPVALGVALDLVYVVRIGGDFMSGRFLTSAFVAALCLGSRAAPPLIDRWDRWWPLALAAVIGLGSLSPPRPPFTGSDYGEGDWRRMPASGIVAERRFYYQASGLMRAGRRFHTPDTDEPKRVERYLSQGRRVVLRDMVGFFGYAARRRLHVVDVLGLGDPLIARLPAQQPWRIGHFYRIVPDGYVESLEQGVNRIRDPALAAYYDQLKLVTQGPLWNAARVRAIVSLNLTTSPPRPATPPAGPPPGTP
jgi:arabinofuranosyltransferase